MAKSIVVNFLGDASKLKGAAKDARSSLDRFSDGAGRVGKAMTVGVTLPIVAAMASGAKSLAEIDRLNKQTEAALRSTGGAAGVTASKITGLSDSIEKMSGMEAESVQSGANLLLTFTNIKDAAGKNNDIFTQTTRTMADMSTALGQDTKSSALQLGKALNDPIKGVTALQRVGVSFTQSQKDQIKTLVDSGRTMDAQKLILKELQTEFGGSAKAFGESASGQFAKFKNSVGELTETLASFFMPVLQKLVAWLRRGMEWFQNLSQSQKKTVVTILAVVAAVGPMLMVMGKVIAVVRGVRVALMFLNAHPIFLALTALVLAIVLVVRNFDKIKGAAKAVWNALKAGGKGVVNFIIGILNTLIGAFEKGVNLLLAPARKLSTMPIVGAAIPDIPMIKIPRIPTFDLGGVVPGRIGAPTLALVHGGETILPTHRKSAGGSVLIVNVNVAGNVWETRKLTEELRKEMSHLLQRRGGNLERLFATA